MERPTLRARLPAGLLTQAARGDFALPLPLGRGRHALQRVPKAPALAGQHRRPWRVTILRQRPWARHVRRCVTAHAVTLPRRDAPGALVGKQPPVAASSATRKHPASAGALVDGRSRQMRQDPAQRPTAQQRRPLAPGHIRGKAQYPASIGGEPLAQLQARRRANYAESARHKTRGLPRPGAALVQGSGYGGACAHTRRGPDTPSTRDVGTHRRPHDGVPVWPYRPAAPVAACGVQAFVQARWPRARAL